MTDSLSPKDKILNRIQELEHTIEYTKIRKETEFEAMRVAKAEGEKTRKVYEDVKAQLETIGEVLRKQRDHFHSTQEAFRESERVQRSSTEEISRLHRELSRLQDAEKINEEYLTQLNAFRESCLTAPWRKENRTDGLGALKHQIEGAIHLAVAKRALLGDKRGLGKSLTSLIYMDYMKSNKAVVICPSDTMDNFIREIRLWAPHRSVIKIGKMTKAERDFVLPTLLHVPEFTLVFNYEAWRRDSDFIQDIINLRPDTVIWDEAHKAKTWESFTSKGIQSIVFGLNTCPSCRPDGFAETEYLPILRGTARDNINYAICQLCQHEGFITEFCSVKNVLPMTGTPILNRPQELFPHLRALDPANFIEEKTFLYDFCRKNASNHWVWQYGAEEQLMEKIGPRFLARDRKAAGIIIPPAQPIEHIITNEEFQTNYPKQFKAYEQVRQYAQLVLDPDQNIAMAMPYVIVVLMRLRQVLTWPAGIVLKRTDPETEIEYEVARLNVRESCKLDKAEELIKDINEEEEATLTFSMFKDPLHELERRFGPRTISYTGDTSSYMKNQMQLDFDPKTAPREPRWDNLLGTYQAMGTGLNLNRATHAVMLDRHWNPGGEDQAEGRIDRLGTTKDTYIHRIMVEGTVDTWMKSLIDEKAQLIGGFSSQADMFNEVYRALRSGEL